MTAEERKCISEGQQKHQRLSPESKAVIHLSKLSGQGESEVDLLERISLDVAAAQAHDAAAGVLCDMTGAKHQVFNHCTQTPAADGLLFWRAMLQGLLAAFNPNSDITVFALRAVFILVDEELYRLTVQNC